MKAVLFILLVILQLPFSILVSFPPENVQLYPAVDEVAYFKFDAPPAPETFVIRLADAEKIAQARAILDGSQPSKYIMGQIIKAPAPYNPSWSYYLASDSIQFIDAAIEVCQAPILYVEQHLDEVCGAFLPGCTWCPLNSRLIEEVQPKDITWDTYLPFVIRIHP